MGTYRRISAVAVGVVVMLAVPATASAGGWWSGIDLENSHVPPGGKLEINSQVMFPTNIDTDEAGAETFYAYLMWDLELDAYDWNSQAAWRRDWTLGDTRALRLGEIEFVRWDGNLARARGEFTLPEVPAGKYWVMLCNLGCEQPLGDQVPTRFTVVEDPQTAHLVRGLSRLELKLHDQASALRRRLVEGTRADIEQDRQIDVLRARVKGLATEIAVPAEERSEPTPWLPYAGWFAFGALLGAVVGRTLQNRLGSRRAIEPEDWDPSEELERELAGSDR